MTVCIAALCEKSSGVVLVADRMITSGLAIQFEHPVSGKVTALSENCLAMTAGDALAYTELFDAVQRTTSNRQSTTVEEYVEVLKGTYQELRKRQIVERIFMPLSFDSFEAFYHGSSRIPQELLYQILGQLREHSYGLEVLVGGVNPIPAHIYSVQDPGTSNCFDSIGFHVIGSGTNLALSSLMASKCHADLPLRDALMRAVAAKVAAENAPGVGRDTDAYVITRDSRLHFEGDQMRHLRRSCRKWKNGDGDRLKELDGMIERAALRAREPAAGAVAQPNTIPEGNEIGGDHGQEDTENPVPEHVDEGSGSGDEAAG